MKFACKIVFAAGMMCFLLLNSGCKPDPNKPEPPTDVQIGLLTSGPWNTTSVTLDNVPQTTEYADFVLTITGTKGQNKVGFSTSGRPALSAWPPSGNFIFDATTPTTLLSRDDNPAVPVTYTVTATNLMMKFQYSGNGFSRIGNVKGEWIFNFTH